MERKLIKTNGIVKEILKYNWYLVELAESGQSMKVLLSQKATENLAYTDLN